MSNHILGKCRYCGYEVYYDSGKTYTKCSRCGETLAIAEFQNEQVRINLILEERDQLIKELETAKQALSAEQKKADKAYTDINELTSSVDRIHNLLNENQNTLNSFESKWKQAELNKLVEQYHQAENLQLDMAFDKAEEEYKKVLILGGKDPEVYWRIVLCHYGIVYQMDNEGNRIPSILRPDLSSQIAIVKDLENSYRSEDDRKLYSDELKQINSLLEKYRHCQMSSQYDVFISVKQKLQINGEESYTKDYKIGNDLFNHLTRMGLRVFNSEQQSCRKEREPYILAALLSSRVMIVVGTNTEYMESQWVQNEWRRFQWLQKEEKTKTGRTDRKLLCFIDHMTGYDLPKDLEPIQAIVNEAGAYQELDRVITEIFPDRINHSATGTKTNIEAIRQKMSNWLAYERYDRVLEEHQKIIDEGIYSLDAFIGLYSICAEHKLPRISMLETAAFDLNKENIIQVILENNKDQNDLKMIHDLVDKNRENLKETQYELGERYKNGIDVEQSDSEAFKCYKVSAELGKAEAQFELGCCYQTGFGIRQNQKEAFKWYEKSAVQGFAAAQYEVGNRYLFGSGIGKNQEKAYEWFQKSADQGNLDALNMLKRWEYKDVKEAETTNKPSRKDTEQKNIEKAISSVKKSNEKTQKKDFSSVEKTTLEATIKAIHELLGRNRENLSNDVTPISESEAKNNKVLSETCREAGKSNQEHYTHVQENKGKENKNPISTNAVGDALSQIIDKNKSTVLDPQIKAFNSLKKTCTKKGDAALQYQLGCCYAYGLGVERNLSEAFSWFQKSAEQGFSNAQLMVGYFYQYGICDKENQTVAEKWYKKSAEQNCALACFSLCSYYCRCSNITKAVAIKWQLKGALLEEKELSATHERSYPISYVNIQEYEAKVSFWKENLSGVYHRILYSPNINAKKLYRIASRTGIPLENEKVIALIEAVQLASSFFDKGYTTVIITAHKIIIDLDSDYDYTLKVDFSDIKSATSFYTTSNRYYSCSHFNLLLKNGSQLFSVATVKSPLNYCTLADAVNLYLSKFEKTVKK